MASDDSSLMGLLRAIGAKDLRKAAERLRATPHLARVSVDIGARRKDAKPYYFERINHYVYAGDTALHLAAAAHAADLVRMLLDSGADVGARNRRAAQPLHYAADGVPGSDGWDPRGQAAVIEVLVAAGGTPNARDASGVTPLHRAVRTRCATAVRALLEAGADPNMPNRSGSTPMTLAVRPSGRGGSGSAEAREQQAMIVDLLKTYGAVP